MRRRRRILESKIVWESKENKGRMWEDEGGDLKGIRRRRM